MAAGSLADLSGVGAGGGQRHSVAINPNLRTCHFSGGVCAMYLSLLLSFSLFSCLARSFSYRRARPHTPGFLTCPRTQPPGGDRFANQIIDESRPADRLLLVTTRLMAFLGFRPPWPAIGCG